MEEKTKHITRNLIIAFILLAAVVCIFVFIPIKLLLWISAFGTTLFYINLWLVAICNFIVEKQYESNFDFIYRMICMILMSLFWGLICYLD